MSRKLNAMGLHSALGKDDRVFQLSMKLKSKSDPLIPTMQHAAKYLILSVNTIRSYPRHEQSDFSLYDIEREKWYGNSSLSEKQLHEQLLHGISHHLDRAIVDGKVLTLASAEAYLDVPKDLIRESVRHGKLDIFDDEYDKWLIHSGVSEQEAIDRIMNYVQNA